MTTNENRIDNFQRVLCRKVHRWWLFVDGGEIGMILSLFLGFFSNFGQTGESVDGCQLLDPFQKPIPAVERHTEAASSPISKDMQDSGFWGARDSLFHLHCVCLVFA